MKKVHSCGKILIASIWWMIVYNFQKNFAEKNLYANRKAILSAGVVAFSSRPTQRKSRFSAPFSQKFLFRIETTFLRKIEWHPSKKDSAERNPESLAGFYHLFEQSRFVRLFPSKAFSGAPEMPKCCSIDVAGLFQIEHFDDSCGGKVKNFFDDVFDF